MGDPKQAIYSFRGGDLDAYLSARPTDDARISSLATTYRSAPGLVTALNALFGRSRAFATPDLSYPAATAARRDEELPLPDDGHGRLVAWVIPDADTEDWTRAQPRRARAAACTATAIVDLLDRTMGAGATRVNPSHVAVLTRTNLEARLVHEALRARRVPSVVRDDGDVMQSGTASDLAAILKAVLSPTHPGWRRAAMATRLFGYDSAMLAALTTADADRWLNNFSTWNDLWHRHGIAALMARLEADSGATLRLARAPTGARHLTDLRHLVELLQAREAEGQHAPIKLLQWFEGERMSESSSADERLHRLEEGRRRRTGRHGTPGQGAGIRLCVLPPTCGRCYRTPVSPTVSSSAATTAGCSPTAHNGTIRQSTAPLPLSASGKTYGWPTWR